MSARAQTMSRTLLYPPSMTQPSLAAAVATRNFDHRLIYLDYEGPISGGRGSVRRLDGGSFDWVERADGRLIADVRGRLLAGRVELVRVGGEEWRLRRVGTSGFPA